MITRDHILYFDIHHLLLCWGRVILRQAASYLDNPKFVFLDATVVDDAIRFVSSLNNHVLQLRHERT
jgi:hypothetical protein